MLKGRALCLNSDFLLLYYLLTNRNLSIYLLVRVSFLTVPYRVCRAIFMSNRFVSCWLFLLCLTVPAAAQEKSVRPGINDSFRDPNVNEFVGRFEVESREVFVRRQEILAACRIQPGQTVADIGAGTGLFTRLFSEAVGKDGRVIAVDITQKFLDHILETSRGSGQVNVETLLCKPDSTELPAATVDVAFICDTYHHFEFPTATLKSLYRALKPGGRVVLIDFRRVEGESTDWVLSHVRAGQDVFEREITDVGFRRLGEETGLLKENYFVTFQKPESVDEHAEHVPGRGAGMGMGRGMGRGPGRGMGRGGMGPGMQADQEVFHFLLEHHAEIRRSVKTLENGVETLTESDNAEVAAKIQEHVSAMHQRVLEGRGLRFWDELFVAIFENYDRIEMMVENTEKGVRVIETSSTPAVVPLIQAHAEVVSHFVARGFDEAHENHPVPSVQPAPAKLEFPVIAGHGGVVARPDAAEQPRAGAKIIFDVTANAEPTEVNRGLERAARLLNLYGTAGLKASDVRIVVVLHGEATKTALNDAAYSRHFGAARNPGLGLIEKLQQAGVEIFVCGQALSYKGFADADVAAGVPIAAAALTVIANRQSDGYTCMVLH